MFLQPVRDGGRLAVAEQVNGPAGFDVDEDGAVVPAAAEREKANKATEPKAKPKTRDRNRSHPRPVK